MSLLALKLDLKLAHQVKGAAARRGHQELALPVDRHPALVEVDLRQAKMESEKRQREGMAVPRVHRLQLFLL